MRVLLRALLLQLVRTARGSEAVALEVTPSCA